MLYSHRTAVADNRAWAKVRERYAGYSGSPATIGQPLRPVILRPPSFGGGSPCQNTLLCGIVAIGKAAFRHRNYVDRVTKYLSATVTCRDVRQNCCDCGEGRGLWQATGCIVPNPLSVYCVLLIEKSGPTPRVPGNRRNRFGVSVGGRACYCDLNSRSFSRSRNEGGQYSPVETSCCPTTRRFN